MRGLVSCTIRWLPAVAAAILIVCGCVSYPQRPCCGPVVSSGTLTPTADPLLTEPAAPATTVPDATTPVGPADPVSAVRLRTSAPAQATVGQTITLQIEVSNTGRGPARDVVVSQELPAGLTLQGSTPEAAVSGNRLEWRLGDLAAGQAQVVELSSLVARGGIIDQCPSVVTADGQSARDCARTSVAVPTIEARIVGPSTAVVGQDVTFQATIVNRGNVPATGLLAVARFDAGLEHEVATSPIERNLDDLQPGRSETFNITFRVTRAGRLCNTLEIVSGGAAQATAQACVTASNPPPPSGTSRPNPSTGPALPDTPDSEASNPALTIKHSGPASKDVGETAEFTINVTNSGDTPLTNLVVTAAYDVGLAPENATDGHKVDAAGRLTWTFGSLRPGKSIALQVVCRCEEAAPRLCGTATATAAEVTRKSAQACVRVLSPKSELSLAVNSLRNPVTVGKEVTYEIRVKNIGGSLDRNVVVEFTVPQGMTFVPLGTTAPGGSRRVTEVQAPTYRFDPVAEVKANETLTYRVRVRAEKPGDTVFRVRVDSDGLEQPVDGDETTQVLAS
jgi:uncharacterized repeat protein (TIGR01451 family)